jgi:hypothetical protein
LKNSGRLGGSPGETWAEVAAALRVGGRRRKGRPPLRRDGRAWDRGHERPMHFNDMHATMLYQLGLDHKRA